MAAISALNHLAATNSVNLIFNQHCYTAYQYPL